NNLCQAVLNVNVPFSGTTTGIIYQNTDFGGIGTQFMMAYYYNLSAVSVGSAGNTSWDFTSWQLDDLDTLNFLDPNQTANGPNFSNANLVLARRTDTTYYQKSTSNLSIVGLVGDIF